MRMARNRKKQQTKSRTATQLLPVIPKTVDRPQPMYRNLFLAQCTIPFALPNLKRRQVFLRCHARTPPLPHPRSLLFISRLLLLSPHRLHLSSAPHRLLPPPPSHTAVAPLTATLRNDRHRYLHLHRHRHRHQPRLNKPLIHLQMHMRMHMNVHQHQHMAMHRHRRLLILILIIN